MMVTSVARPKQMRIYFIVLLMTLLTACAAESNPELADTEAGGFMQCPAGAADVTDVVCAAVYDPVCGQLSDIDGAELQTFSNACRACATPAVAGYKKGACE